MQHVSAHVYRLLLDQLGPQRWWPDESPFEVMAGAILVQNTAWRNVELGSAKLREPLSASSVRRQLRNKAECYVLNAEV